MRTYIYTRITFPSQATKAWVHSAPSSLPLPLLQSYEPFFLGLLTRPVYTYCTVAALWAHQHTAPPQR